MSSPMGQRARSRPQQKALQAQLDQLAGLMHQATMELAQQNDALRARVTALEEALKKAQAAKSTSPIISLN